ncbi:hypothetical protein [Streptomyces varsoviensis]|uniref:hypothetical protein n=1 Tax=Streptomyces varsoviensis TaxID=67373 RepID=UPI001FE09088|nr:hypothetical protein [Streptomyces varsoviensis]
MLAMYDPFIRWYRESAATSVLAEQVEILAKHGIQLRHPALGPVMVIDVEGNDVPVGQDELDRLLALRIASVNVNWWFSSDTHLIDNYSYEPLGCEIQTFWLDHLSVEEVEKVEAAVTSAAAEIPTLTRALIIDRRGICEPDDWNSLVLYDGQRVPGAPDRLIVQSQIASRILQTPSTFMTEAIGSGMVELTPHNPS